MVTVALRGIVKCTFAAVLSHSFSSEAYWKIPPWKQGWSLTLGLQLEEDLLTQTRCTLPSVWEPFLQKNTHRGRADGHYAEKPGKTWQEMSLQAGNLDPWSHVGILWLEDEDMLTRVTMTRVWRAAWGGRWVLVAWMGQESWNQMYSSGMNTSPAMAPQPPGCSGTPPPSSLSPKKTTFQSVASLSPGVFSPSPAHQPSGSSQLNSPTPSIMSSPKLWQKASVSRLAEEFFWIGGSVVAQPKWRLGQIGNIHPLIIKNSSN